MHLSFTRTAVASALLALLLPMTAQAETISVVTSFPKELTTAYKKAYEAKYPNDKVEYSGLLHLTRLRCCPIKSYLSTLALATLIFQPRLATTRSMIHKASTEARLWRVTA